MTARRGKRPVLRRLLLVSVAGVTLLMAAAFFIIQHRPAWYAPVESSSTLVESVRRQTALAADDFGDRLVHGQAFEIAFTQEQLNEWIAAAPILASELDSGWPDVLHSPALRLEREGLRIGALAESSGWRVIAGAQIAAEVIDGGESLAIQLRGASAGSMPIPHDVVRRVVAPLIREIREKSGRSSGAAVIAGQDGTTLLLPSRYVWPNGQRAFRIHGIKIDEQAVRLFVQPE